MKILMKFFTLLIVLSVGIANAFAAMNTPVNVTAENITETSLSLNWDNVEDAFGYHVYYSTTSGFEILNAQKHEYINKKPLEITGLLSGTQYYFVVSAYNEQGDESDFSTEVGFTTQGGGISTEESEFNSASDFKLMNIDVLAQNKISLFFSAELENNEDSERIFKVVEKNDEFMEYTISDSQVNESDATKIDIVFGENLPVNTEFKLTVISILDKSGRNIESGLESFENFIIEESMLDVVYNEETQLIEIINQDTSTTPLENQGDADSQEKQNPENSQDQNQQESGNEVSDDNQTEPVKAEEEQEEKVEDDLNAASEKESDPVKMDVVSAGQDATALPTTGPEHIFMLILALVFGAMSFVWRFKK